jgi:hypothetical protein
MLARHGIGEDTRSVAVSVCQLGRSAGSNLGCFGVFRACLPMRLNDLSCGAQLQAVDGGSVVLIRSSASAAGVLVENEGANLIGSGPRLATAAAVLVPCPVVVGAQERWDGVEDEGLRGGALHHAERDELCNRSSSGRGLSRLARRSPPKPSSLRPPGAS